jgi:hypothetical protein
VSSTRVSPASQDVGPVTDPIAAFGLVVGWALIVVGLFFLGLALTN